MLATLAVATMCAGACSSDAPTKSVAVGTGGTVTGGTTPGTGGVAGATGGASGGEIASGGTPGTGGAVDAGLSTGGTTGGTSATCNASETRIANTCQAGWSAILGKYILNNNWLGTAGATGEQCLGGTCQDEDVVGWVTDWNWSGGTGQVLTYASAIFGWQYGFQIDDTGLPIEVASDQAINCGWDFTLSQTSGAYNVAYDIWLHPTANPPSTGGQADEIKIWLNQAGDPAPVGSVYASGISLGGATWTLYEGNVGWPVHSYLRTGNTSSATLDVMAFMKDLVTRGRIPSTRYVTGVQAGVEVRSGGGTLTTNGFYCRIE